MNKTLKIFVAAILLLLPTYLIRFKIAGIPTTFLEIYIYAIFLLFVVTERKNLFKLISNKFILPAVLIIIALISSYFAADKTAALGQWKAIFFDGILALTMFYNLRADLVFKKLSLNFYLISALFVSLWGILQHLNIVGLLLHQQIDPSIASELASGRILGPFESPNYLAMFISPVVILLIIIYFELQKEKYQEFKCLMNYIFPALLVFFSALILTQSASAFLAIIITLGLYFFLRLKTKIKWLYVTILALGIIFATWFLVNHSTKSGSVAARAEIYRAAVRIGEQHPVLGIGMGNFESYFQKLPIVGRLNYEAMHPHDIFLAFWVYMGIPGLLAFLALLYVVLRKPNYHSRKIYYFALILILFNGLSDTTIFKNDLAIIFWYFVALLL